MANLVQHGMLADFGFPQRNRHHRWFHHRLQSGRAWKFHFPFHFNRYYKLIIIINTKLKRNHLA
jgi:hypothetical protein